MRNGHLPEPPSVVESESGWADKSPIKDDNEDFVVLDSIGSAHYSRSLPRNSVNVDSLQRNFRFSSFTNFSAWVSSINDFVDRRRQRLMEANNDSGDISHRGSDAVMIGNGGGGLLGNGGMNYDAADVVSVASHGTLRNVSATKILNHYTVMLKVLGLRNFGDPDNCLHKALNIVWMGFIFLVMITGYSLNIKLCQDQKTFMEEEKYYGFCNDSKITYHYIEGICRTSMESLIPSLIHLVAYGYTFWIYRVKESEHVEALLQKALVIPSCVTCTNTASRRDRFRKKFRFIIYMIITGIFLHLCLTIANSFFGKALLQSTCSKAEPPHPNQTEPGEYEMLFFKDPYAEGVFYAIPTFIMYFFLCPILMTFILQTMLISYLLTELRETLREKRSTLKSLMQEAHDISTFLHRMNSESGPAMSFILFYLTYGLFVDLFSVSESIAAADSFGSLFNSTAGCTKWLGTEFESICEDVKVYGAVSMVVVVARNAIVILFILLTITKGCRIATSHKRLMNQALETRVFGYTHSERSDELDSFHYYIRALRMRAKLFQYPMETKKLLFPFALGVMAILCLDLAGKLTPGD